MSERLSLPVSDRLALRWPLPVSDDFPLAWRDGQALTHEHFRRDLTLAARALAVLNQPRIVLFEADVYDFTVWMFAAWALGLRVILPGDDLPVTRAALTAPWVGRRQGLAQNAVEGWDEQGAEEAVDHLLPDFGAPGLLLFTSGSSGEPCLIDKTLGQLRLEIEAFQQAFGSRLVAGTRFVMSVPHQHMFGLPFGLLWPLTFAYPLVSERLRYAEDFWRLPEADYVLVSAPTFLKHLPELAAAGFTAERGARWRMAVAAGSPLPASVQKGCRDLLQAPIFEIYGSTETGAAARREEHEAPWQAMPGVRLSVDADTSQLRIHSPFLAPEELEAGYLAKDLARIGEHGFELIGRVDRIVKIGEKRISLGKVETAVSGLPEVERVTVLPLNDGLETRRKILGAVVILTDAGRDRLAELGKVHLDRALREALRDQVEPLALPRRWRYVDALPNNAMGKTTLRDLERLFAPELPQATCLLQKQDAAGAQVQLQLHVDSDLVWFVGHFPELPVLPGVVQIDWVVHFGRLHFADLGCGSDGPVTSVTGLKFTNLIRPGDQASLALRWRRDEAQLEFSYHVGDTPCSCGVLVFRKTSLPE